MHQPHAMLAVHGFKTIETRHADTSHRGWIAIHATKEWPDEYRAMLEVWPTVECLAKLNCERTAKGWAPLFEAEFPAGEEAVAARLPRGAIVGVAWLAKTEKTDGITERWNRREDTWKLDEPEYNDVPQWEPSFGDYSNGRRAYWLAYPRALQTPIPVNGLPGIWDTRVAAERDGIPARDSEYDEYEYRINRDLGEQGIVLPDFSDSAVYRLVNRRGEVYATLPRNM